MFAEVDQMDEVGIGDGYGARDGVDEEEVDEK